MEDYHTKYAKQISKLTLYDLNHYLNNWRNNLREELEGLIYLRNGLKEESNIIIKKKWI